MSALDIVCFTGSGLIGAGVLAFIVQTLLEGSEHKLWPRGLRWFPDLWLDTGERLHRALLRLFWPEKRALYRGRRALRLESYDQQWRLWEGVSEGGIPRWAPWTGSTDGRWEPREKARELCPCGYGDECAVWCGDGHADGGWVFATDGTGWQLRGPSCPDSHTTKEEGP